MVDHEHPSEDREAAALDRAVRIAALLDLYGPLLTERQLQFIKLHYEEDLSFGEIAREFSVSRQAIHDAVKHAEQALEEFEAKLGFQARLAETGNPIATATSPGAAPTNIDETNAVITGLTEIAARLARSGGVIYNADTVGREISALADQLKKATHTDHV